MFWLEHQIHNMVNNGKEMVKNFKQVSYRTALNLLLSLELFFKCFERNFVHLNSLSDKNNK